MIKTAYAVAVSAIAASLFVAFPSLSPQVSASAPIIGAKGDRATSVRWVPNAGKRRGRISMPLARAMRAFRSRSLVTFA